MKNVVFYIRVSTQEQVRHGLSLGDQREALRKYAIAHGYNVVGIYEDAGISARKSYKKRPALLRLLQDCTDGGIDLILFVKLDRWFRNIAGYYQVQDILDKYHVAWQAINEDYETATASGRLKVNIMLAVAQDEADRTSERIKFSKEARRERNEALTQRIPLGYKIENKHVVIDEENAKTVRRIFDVYLQSGSLGDVRNEFPELHLTYRQLYTILHSDRYLGNVCGSKAPAIITQEMHDRAVSYRGQAPRSLVEENRVYLFAGLVKCPVCGSTMTSTFHETKYKGKSYGTYIYYRCGLHRRKGNCSNSHCYSESDIEEYLLQHLETTVALANVTQPKPASNRNAVKRSTLERKLSKLSDLYLSDLISKDDYASKYKAITQQIAALPPDTSPSKPPKLPKNWRGMYDDLSRKGKQKFWYQLISTISLNETGVEAFSLRDFVLIVL